MISLSLRSISIRYTATIMLSFVILGLIFASFYHWKSRTHLYDQLDSTLVADAKGLQELYSYGGIELVSNLLNNRIEETPNNKTIYLLTDDRFAPIAGNIDTWPKQLPKDSEFTEIDWPNELTVEIDIRFYHAKLEDNHHLLIGIETLRIEEFEDQTYTIASTILALTVISGLLAGIYLHFTLNRKLRLIAQTFHDISIGKFSNRIPVKKVQDELDMMSITLNGLLDNIEELMIGIQQVSDNIAHDLRTPLTRLRARLEGLAANPSNIPEELDKSLSDLDQVIATFNSLLTISRIETGVSEHPFQTVDLSSLLDDVEDLYDPVLETKNQRLEVHGKKECELKANRDLLFQVFTNLIDNASKYSPDNSQITINFRSVTDRIFITVDNEGSAIDETQLDQVFQRFYRLDKSRHLPGNGLGLSLVSAIIKFHHGNIRLINIENGVRVEIILPKG